MARARGPEDGHGLILLGLLLGILLAALDGTVVGTSLPRIVADLGGLSRLAWLFTAYMLASTVVIPLAGKMSDRIGRRPVFLAGMVTFLAGSALCGLAQTMDQLIAFRFVQGMGAGALFPVAFATVADLYPPSERGKVQGGFGAVFGISSIVGPLLGGFIVDHTTWRWVFYVNIPVGLLAIAVTATHFPRVQPRRGQPIDLLGAVTLTLGLTAVLLAAVMGGVDYAWDSPVIAGLFALGALGLVAFVAVERRARDPLLPLALFREPIFTLSIVATMFLAVGMFGVISFLPLFMQAVIGTTATNSGLVLTPLMIMVVVGAGLSGKLMTRTGYKPWILAGPLLAAAGLGLLAGLHTGSGQGEAIGYLLVIGLGLGFTMATYLVAVQNVVRPQVIGAATGTLTLARTLGGTIGVTALGALLNNNMARELPRHVPAQVLAQLQGGLDPRSIGALVVGTQGPAPDLPPALLAALVAGLRDALAVSLTPLFLAGAVACVIGFAFSVFIRSMPLKGREEYFRPAATALAEGEVAATPAPPAITTARVLRGARAAATAVGPGGAPAPWVAPRIVEVRHEPALPSPGQPALTVVRLVPADGPVAARVELRHDGFVVAQEDALIAPGGSEVRLWWRAPREAAASLVTSVRAPP